MPRSIALDFFGKALQPEHMHDGFCFLDSKDVQHGPSFVTLTEAVAWLHTQPDDVLVRVTLIPEKALAHE